MPLLCSHNHVLLEVIKVNDLSELAGKVNSKLLTLIFDDYDAYERANASCPILETLFSYKSFVKWQIQQKDLTQMEKEEAERLADMVEQISEQHHNDVKHYFIGADTPYGFYLYLETVNLATGPRHEKSRTLV